MHILVIEDDLLVSEVLVDIMETLDYKAVCVRTGSEAVAALDQHDDISIVITDLELPEMHGTEVVRRLLERNGNLRIIYSTGYSDQEYDIDRTSDNFVEIIHKPFEISDIQAAIEKARASN
jgi:CheY-like chemotaxis protein